MSSVHTLGPRMRRLTGELMCAETRQMVANESN